jgi:hypothetical protein
MNAKESVPVVIKDIIFEASILLLSFAIAEYILIPLSGRVAKTIVHQPSEGDFLSTAK